jgi:hypothetical protein
MRDLSLEADFPRLLSTGYLITSEASGVPNCIGYVLGDMEHFWDPMLVGFHAGYYWPPGIPRDDKLTTWRLLFNLFGYRPAETSTPEFGIEKIAIYGNINNDEEGHHVAKQLPSGAWTSKLGPDQDIEHSALDALVGAAYGAVVLIMQRPMQGLRLSPTL